MLPLEPPCPLYFIEPALGAAEASAATRELLGRAPHAADVRNRAALREPRLCFAPYHHVSGRRLAIARTLVPALPPTSTAASRRVLSVTTGTADLAEPPKTLPERADTRVIIADIDLLKPAFTPHRWNLTGFDAAAARLGAILHPFDAARLQRLGTVLSPTVAPEQVAGAAGAAAPGSRIVALQRRTIYFPFWRIGIGFDGGEYEALIDAAGRTGVVWAYTPQGRAAGLEWRAAAATAGAILGWGTRGALLGSTGTQVNTILAAAAAGTALLIAAVLRRRPPHWIEWHGEAPHLRRAGG
ncbi:MAG: hypothetical protein ACRELD_06930 [Longimicrobiales bacterium]